MKLLESKIYVLGKLCKRYPEEHKYLNTNYSLRYASGRHCINCVKVKHYERMKDPIFRKKARKKAVKWREDNPERYQGYLRKYTQWRRAHRAEIREKRRIDSKNSTKNLYNSYIKKLLIDGSVLKSADVPDELIKLKREQIKAMRTLKERRTNEL